MSELVHGPRVLDKLSEFVDIDLCQAAILHGYCGQITAYREAIRFYIPTSVREVGTVNGSNRKSSHRLWLTNQYQELCRDMGEISTLIQTTRPSPSTSTRAGNTEYLTAMAELFQMMLNASLDDLQNFAGKSGEDEARRASTRLEDSWVTNCEARHAVWHAGQVLSCARRMPPASLRNFNAMAVYFASLTLWIYGMLSPGGGCESGSGSFLLLDGPETQETKAFLQLGRGSPGLTLTGDPQDGAELLSNSGMVLTIAGNLLRANFPVKDEPLPPLVESISKLLGDIGAGQAGHGSSRPWRAATEARE